MSSNRDLLRTAMKRSASALKESGPRFALAGSYALWVHGAPEPEHDVDLVVAEPNADQAADVLAAAGFDVERTPEDWLLKAHSDGVVVDVLHRLNGVPVDDALLDRADEHEIFGIRLPVLPPTYVMTVKLRSLTEHYCDFATLLPAARAVREQLDWQRIRDDTAASPFAEAFLLLTDRLSISS
ncbi:MAG: hypothetical protein QOG01_1648 [Pseudonocardiales bacterium]|jgi:predicted nucleotidyltransferase|nr:hypothetical protein [Pseudonocardiales bacterium]